MMLIQQKTAGLCYVMDISIFIGSLDTKGFLPKQQILKSYGFIKIWFGKHQIIGALISATT